MPKYVVTLEERITYDVIVEADNNEDAVDYADAVFCDSADPDAEFGSCFLGREAINTEELTGEQAA